MLTCVVFFQSDNKRLILLLRLFNFVLSFVLGGLEYHLVSTIMFHREILADARADGTKFCESVDASKAYSVFPYHDWYSNEKRTSTCNYRDDWAMGGFLALAAAVLVLCFRSSATLLKHVWLRFIYAEEILVKVCTSKTSANINA